MITTALKFYVDSFFAFNRKTGHKSHSGSVEHAVSYISDGILSCG